MPGATEVVAVLGSADQLVAISHECDFPASVRHAAVVVEPLVESDRLTGSTIDEQVKQLASSGQRLYRLNEPAFIEARPDVVLTQDLCGVCAVTPDLLRRAVRSLPHPPNMVTLNPATIDDVLVDIEWIGRAIERDAESRQLTASLRNRLRAVQEQPSRGRPRILCLEWLSPLYIGGHWVPEMVELAGGADVLGEKGRPSREVTWDDVMASRPDIVVVMPCGYSVARILRELADLRRSSNEWARALGTWSKIVAVDAVSYFSRPGPRLVDGVELLAAIFSGNEAMRFDERQVAAVSPSMFA
jgi:iron complex transport system substrate-binding protein